MTSLLLFAAGTGTRMRHLTADRPKPLVEVAGRSLLDHAISLTNVDGIDQRVVNIHYKGGMIRDHLSGVDIHISAEKDLLETGGGLRNALPLLGPDPVITMNTDAVWNGPNPIKQLLSLWQDDMECLALLIPRKHAIGHKGKGDFLTDDEGRITWGAGHIYTGVQIIRTDRLDAIPDKAFSLLLLWEKMILDGSMYGTLYDGRWCDVGQPESIPLAEDMLKVPYVSAD